MSEFVQDIIREGSSYALLAAFGWAVLRYVKDMFTQNKEFIDKQTDALSKTQGEYTKALMEVVSNYERHSSEINVAMGKLVERIDYIAKDLPDIRTLNLSLREQLRKSEEIVELLKKVP